MKKTKNNYYIACRHIRVTTNQHGQLFTVKVMHLHYRVGIKHHVMARWWGTDMEIEKCISSIWRGPKRKAALWFGVGTGLWSHWFIAESGVLLLKLCENRKSLVSGSCHTQNLLFNHILGGTMNQWNVHTHRSLCQNDDAGLQCVHASMCWRCHSRLPPEQISKHSRSPCCLAPRSPHLRHCHLLNCHLSMRKKER